MPTDELLVEQDGGVLRLVLNRPDTLNSLNASTLDALTKELKRVEKDQTVRVVLLSGSGRAFSSGADIVSKGEGGSNGTLAAANRAVLAIRELDRPVVAAVNGLAAGAGTSLALACDIVLATRSSYFLLSFINIGLMPDGGATALIPAAIGRARAARMALLGEKISAGTAAEWGLISYVVDDDSFADEVDRAVAKLSVGPSLAYAATKRAINSATIDYLAAAIDRETVGQERLLRSTDFIEGVRAFQQKRKAEFTGR
ncbi:enoyl-CoA hydratase [Streptomyces sp. NPDC048430]|uniref:enoyl-CoA hydratase n=1 Tax=Streptomyces sp. NPDC048430 TaxID=3155388 RepID=UPI003445748B